MKVTINRADNRVSVDGEAYNVDLSSLPAYISVIQWFGDKGHIEFINDGRGQFMPNIAIGDISAYHYVIDAWKVAKQEEADRKEAEAKKLRDEENERRKKRDEARKR